jgi:hypothetical protein
VKIIFDALLAVSYFFQKQSLSKKRYIKIRDIIITINLHVIQERFNGIETFKTFGCVHVKS